MAACVLIGTCAMAQTAYDALRYSEQYAEGTARSVAMGNASDDIKAIANYITTSNEEDGVGEAIKKFIP